MAGQMRHLLEVAAMPDVTMQPCLGEGELLAAPGALGDGGHQQLISDDACATLYWNNLLIWLQREGPCRSRFWERAVSARR